MRCKSKKNLTRVTSSPASFMEKENEKEEKEADKTASTDVLVIAGGADLRHTREETELIEEVHKMDKKKRTNSSRLKRL